MSCFFSLPSSSCVYFLFRVFFFFVFCVAVFLLSTSFCDDENKKNQNRDETINDVAKKKKQTEIDFSINHFCLNWFRNGADRQVEQHVYHPDEMPLRRFHCWVRRPCRYKMSRNQVAVEYWLAVNRTQQEWSGMSREFDHWSLLCTINDNTLQTRKNVNHLPSWINLYLRRSMVEILNHPSTFVVRLYTCSYQSRNESVLLFWWFKERFFRDESYCCFSFFLKRMRFYWKKKDIFFIRLNNRNTTIIRIILRRILIQRNFFSCLFAFRGFSSNRPFHFFGNISSWWTLSRTIEYIRYNRCNFGRCRWCRRIRCSD